MAIQQRTNGQFVGKWQHRQSCHRCFKVWVDESAKRFWWFLKSSNTTTNNNSGAKLFRGDEEQMKIYTSFLRIKLRSFFISVMGPSKKSDSP